MPRRRARSPTPEITPSQELTDAIDNLDIISPRPLTRSTTVTPTGAASMVFPPVPVVATVAPIAMHKLKIHGVIVRDEASGEYYAPQKLLFVSNGAKMQVRDIKRKIDDTIEDELEQNPRTEVYRFDTEINYPIKISKVSGIDRGYSGNKIFPKYSCVVRAPDAKRRRVN